MTEVRGELCQLGPLSSHAGSWRGCDWIKWSLAVEPAPGLWCSFHGATLPDSRSLLEGEKRKWNACPSTHFAARGGKVRALHSGEL